MKDLISRLRNIWDNLSSRERILVSAAGGMLLLTLFAFAIVMPFVSLADSARLRAQTAEEQIAAMLRLHREYSDIQSRLAGVEERIQNQKGQHNIRTLLETLARQSTVKIESMEERQAGKNDHYIETKVEVSLKSVSLNQTVKYLHNIESADSQLSVKSLRIKGRQDESQLLDVTFSVSSFEPS